MKHLLAFAAAFAFLGCVGGPELDVPEEDPIANAPARADTDAPPPLERAIERVHLLERCPACGPVPDPWDEIRGPVPDPWAPPSKPERP
jgi:hypothetical protein